MLEVGPGLGVLTRYLADRVALVHAVELDRSLEPHLAALGGRPTCGSASATRSGSTSRRSSRRREARREPALQHRDAARRRDARGQPRARALVRDGAARGRRPVLRAAVDEGVRRGLGARPAGGRAHRLPPGLARRSSGRGRTSTRRSSRSAGVELPRDLAARQAGRRARVLAPAQDAGELAAARAASRSRAARRRGARDDRPRPRTSAPRRSSRPSSSRSPSALAMRRAPATGEDQPRARRRPAPSRRQARAGDGLPAGRARRPDRARAGATRCVSTASPRTRSSARALECARGRGRGRAALARPDRRSASRSPPASAAAAPTRRPRCGSPTRRSPRRCRPSGCTRSRRALGADVPFFLADGPQLGEGDGTELTPLDLPQDYFGPPAAPERHAEGIDRDGLRRASTSARARTAGRSGARRWLDALARVRRPRDLAALPPNDLACSPLADELRRLGAFRADVSGAGPTVYGLFHAPPRRGGRNSACWSHADGSGSRFQRGTVDA